MTDDPFLYQCRHCHNMIDERTHTVWRSVQGWTKKRDQGGDNHVALRRPLNDYMCNACMTLALSGLHPQQQDLFHESSVSGNA
jgi:hypothetical protein